ncbi:MAG TPA: hypothetical protein VM536_04820 [Chloroflexia bacterium]|nr:hypothetical protein [Chloroflexia bacterium]
MAEEIAVGVFPDRASAEAALALLEAHGFQPADVSIVMPDAGDPNQDMDGAAKGAVTNAAAMGGVLGGVGGLLLGLGLLTIPVVGPVLAAGPLMAALGGAALGAGAGGLVGALTNAGLHPHHAARLEQAVRDGSVLVTVAATPRHEEARDLLCDAGATETDFSLSGDEE